MNSDLFRRYIDIVESTQSVVLTEDPVTAFASKAHDEWRQGWIKQNAGQSVPRVKKNSDGTEGDINVPFEKLHPDWQKENLAAGRAAMQAVKQHPNDIEAASEFIHNEWMKRNPKADYNAAQHVPYDQLSEPEKEKDRVHARTMMTLTGIKPQPQTRPQLQQGVTESRKKFQDYIAESERAYSRPVRGDYFAINIREETLFETWICDETVDGIVIYADEAGMNLLENYGYLGESITESQDYEADSDGESVDMVDQGEYDYEGDQAKDQLQTIVRAARRLNGMLDDNDNMPEWVQMKITKASDYIDTAADYMEANKGQSMDEAKYQGREVPLGKPMAGDVKKSKVYVRGPKGNVVKVNFGQKGMKIKKSIPGRRKNFRARHNCDNPGPRWKARYWSCRAW